jgi:hypothetical protein
MLEKLEIVFPWNLELAPLPAVQAVEAVLPPPVEDVGALSFNSLPSKWQEQNQQQKKPVVESCGAGGRGDGGGAIGLGILGTEDTTGTKSSSGTLHGGTSWTLTLLVLGERYVAAIRKLNTFQFRTHLTCLSGTIKIAGKFSVIITSHPAQLPEMDSTCKTVMLSTGIREKIKVGVQHGIREAKALINIPTTIG